MNDQYCNASKGKIIDQFGQPLLLKGVGIGGWLLIEGYMIQSYQKLDRPRTIEQHISSSISESYKDYFIEEWVKRFFQKKDIELLKKQGFNTIRIPIDYQFLFQASDEIEELEIIHHHAVLLDEIIAICRQEKMYVILDLHAAPGGQTGTNIDNSLDDQPRLFMNALYQRQTIYIWKTIANRYKEEPYIVAYDLLNEPLPNWFSKYNNQLMPLYQKIIKEIRLVDPHHMITLEGLHWSTDLNFFTSLKEDNILLQFHKYWSNPDQESIQDYLDLRDKLETPLIMGEGGENNLLWYSAVFKLYRQLDISYAFWTYKKMDASNSIVSYKKPTNWEAFLDGELTSKEAKETLDILLENISFDAAKLNQAVPKHILQIDNFTTPAYAFDFYGEGISKHSKVSHETSFRNQDGLKIVNNEGNTVTPNFKHYNGEALKEEDTLYLYLHENEWVHYTFFSSTDQKRILTISCDKPDKLLLYLNQTKIPHQSGITSVELIKGKNILKMKAESIVICQTISIS